jgi:hypothetical protein
MSDVIEVVVVAPDPTKPALVNVLAPQPFTPVALSLATGGIGPIEVAVTAGDPATPVAVGVTAPVPGLPIAVEINGGLGLAGPPEPLDRKDHWVTPAPAGLRGRQAPPAQCLVRRGRPVRRGHRVTLDRLVRPAQCQVRQGQRARPGRRGQPARCRDRRGRRAAPDRWGRPA